MIDLLLATYNGERYLPQQLASLENQTVTNWRLLARDDGSTDATLQVLNQFAAKHPSKVRVLSDQQRNLGPRGNFACLLEHSSAPYTMFCDQDDVWLPQKIELTWQKMQQLEQRFGVHTPLLVYTDLQVVNQQLERLDSSFWHMQYLNPASNSLNRLLVQTVVTGCTVMINEPLRRLANPIPPQAVMHDWWLALVAVAFGHLDYVQQATILYRQHGANDTGASRFNFDYVWKRVRRFGQLKQVVDGSQNQAKAFLQRYGDWLSPAQFQLVNTYAHLQRYNFVMRRYWLLRNGYFKTGLVRNVGMFLRV